MSWVRLDRAFFRVGHSRCQRCSSSHSSAGTSGRTHWPAPPGRRGQPTQYGVGRGSQLSILVVLDHGRKEAPPGVIDNYIDWLRPRLHGLDDPRYPSLVGVLIVNTNLPVPSAWPRRRI
jgi:hypothetical protein